MRYSEFNRRVFDFYLSREVSAFFTLSIDIYEFNSIITTGELKGFTILKGPWLDLVNIDNGIPQYFGLLAIQCVAATLMQNDENYADDNYKIRLADLLGLTDMNELNSLFYGHDKDNPAQEEIWYHAKMFLENNYGQILSIPERKYYTGRFVQYPKSQSLLNTEDLKYFTTFFSEEFQVGELITVKYFERKLKNRFPFLHKTTRTERLLDDSEKQNSCIKQVYNYYNLWDGTVYVFENKNKSNKNAYLALDHPTNQKLVLLFENELPQFYVIDNEGKENYPVSIDQLFAVKRYKYIHSRLILFSEMEDYGGEYEDSRFIYKSVACFVVTNQYIKPSEREYLNTTCFHKLKLSEDFILYKVEFSDLSNWSPLYSYFSTDRLNILKGGLRLNRGNHFLKGFGPYISHNSPYSIIHENRKCDYNPQSCGVGKYKVRTESFRDIEFEITNGPELEDIILASDRGWKLYTYSFSKEYDLQGLFFSGKKPDVNNIRTWIELNTKGKTKNEINNNLLKALKNYKDEYNKGSWSN